MDAIEETGEIETLGTALHGDHVMLCALIRILEEKQALAPGEVESMAQQIFAETVAENQRKHRENMQAGINRCLEELARPDITDQDREMRQHLLAHYESELAKP